MGAFVDWLTRFWMNHISRDPWKPVWFNKHPKPTKLKGGMIIGSDPASGPDWSVVNWCCTKCGRSYKTEEEADKCYANPNCFEEAFKEQIEKFKKES